MRFGTTNIIGRRMGATPSARATMCFVLYTAMASYTAMMISRIITGSMPRAIPRMAVMPTARISPTAFMTYHSPLFVNATMSTIAMAIAPISDGQPVDSGDSESSASSSRGVNT